MSLDSINNKVRFATGRCQMKLHAKKKKSESSEDTIVAILHSHHLLDHKPDNLILKGGKYKLNGVACLGRPGMALCVGSSKSLKKFRGALEAAMPQKRFKTKLLENVTPELCGESLDEGFVEVSQGEFRTTLASIGEEAEFFVLTGIASEVATGGSEEKETSSGGGGGTSSKKKRKGKRRGTALN